MTPALRRPVTLSQKAIFIIEIAVDLLPRTDFTQHLPKPTRGRFQGPKLRKALWSNRKAFRDLLGTHWLRSDMCRWPTGRRTAYMGGKRTSVLLTKRAE